MPPLDDLVKEADAATGVQPSQTNEPQAVATPELTDPDDLELENARKAVEAEGADDKTGAQPETATGATAPAAAASPTDPAKPAATPASPSAAAPATTEAPDGPMIPKARFDEALSKVREDNAKLQGENEAMKLMINRGGSAPATPQPQTPSAGDRLKTIKDERIALAKKFDDGAISQAERTAKEIELEDQAHTIREEQLAIRLKPQNVAQPVSDRDSLGLENLTVELEAKHPYVELIKDPDHWRFLHLEATKQLAAEGKKIPVGVDLPERDRFLLRERMAVLSDQYGPQFTGKTIEKPAAAAPQSGTPPAKPGLSPQAQARQGKLETAANAPPDISRMTPAATGTGEYSDAQISSMSDDEIAALPRTVRDRFLQSSA